MVGSYCCVINCRSSSHDSRRKKKLDNRLSFYRFPVWRQNEGSKVSEVTRRRREAWVSAVGRPCITFSQISSSMRVCSRHFHSGKPAYGMLELHPDWAPSLHLGHDEVKATDRKRLECQLKRKKKPAKATDTTPISQGDARHSGAAEGNPAYGAVEAHPDQAPTLDLGHDEIKATETEKRLSHHQRKPAKKTTDATQIGKEDPGDTGTAGGKPAFGTLETDPVWAPSVHTGQREVKATKTAQGDIWAEDGGTCNSEPAVKLETECSPCTEIDHVLIKNEAEERAECDFCECMRAEVNRLLEENRELRRELDERKMSEEFLKADDVKVMYYTGLASFNVLMDVLSQVMPFLAQRNKVLSPFQMLFLTLMRLRLDLPLQLVADLFHVDLKTVSTTFVDTMDVLYAQLGPLIDWPERKCLLATMPHKLVETFGDCAAIILDCLEVGIEGPSSLRDQAKSLSHNQRNRTVKYLVGITPAGAISFVSKGFEGSYSDKHVAENCGVLDKLLPGDLVLTDHGFDIEDNMEMMYADVKDPAFSGQQQLDVKGLEEKCRVSHLRVHLERVMCIRDKYTMLNKAVPNSLVRQCEGEEITLLDKIITVCCALANIFPSVVVQYDDGHDE